MDQQDHNQQEPKVEEATRAIPPVTPPANETKRVRQRRTERFAGLTS